MVQSAVSALSADAETLTKSEAIANREVSDNFILHDKKKAQKSNQNVSIKLWYYVIVVWDTLSCYNISNHMENSKNR